MTEIRCNRLPARTVKLNGGGRREEPECYELREIRTGAHDIESYFVKEFETLEQAQAYADEHYPHWHRGGLLR